MQKKENISTVDGLINNYLSGSATLAQNEELMQWLEASDENRIYFSQQKALWLYSEKEIPGNHEEKWEQLKYRLSEHSSNLADIEQEEVRSEHTFSWFFRYAASVIVLIGISTLAYFILKPNKPSALAKNELSVPYGSRSMLSLPDGTKLWVNSGSKLSYGTDFGKNNRDINLTGEAYFEVAKNPHLPFVVHAANLKIKALGTAFDVKAYPDEKIVETTLVHGLVEIEKIGQASRIYLKPSQKVVLSNTISENHLNNRPNSTIIQPNNNPTNDASDQKEDRLVPKIDTEKETSWKDGKLIFDREPLKSLAIKLERRYDVHFTITSEKLKNYIFTGTFNDVSLEQIMEAMHYSSPIDYLIKGKEVKVFEKYYK